MLADAALKQIDHPFADQHLSVDVRVGDGRSLPNDAEAEALNAEEDDLVARLDGLAVYAGRTNSTGLADIALRDGKRRCGQCGDAAWAGVHPDRKITVGSRPDMDWSFQKELGVG